MQKNANNCILLCVQEVVTQFIKSLIILCVQEVVTHSL